MKNKFKYDGEKEKEMEEGSTHKNGSNINLFAIDAIPIPIKQIEPNKTTGRALVGCKQANIISRLGDIGKVVRLYAIVTLLRLMGRSIKKEGSARKTKH